MDNPLIYLIAILHYLNQCFSINIFIEHLTFKTLGFHLYKYLINIFFFWESHLLTLRFVKMLILIMKMIRISTFLDQLLHNRHGKDTFGIVT